MDNHLRLRLEEACSYGPEHAAELIEWLHGFAQFQGRREARKQSGLANRWHDIERAVASARKALAGE